MVVTTAHITVFSYNSILGFSLYVFADFVDILSDFQESLFLGFLYPVFKYVSRFLASIRVGWAKYGCGIYILHLYIFVLTCGAKYKIFVLSISFKNLNHLIAVIFLQIIV